MAMIYALYVMLWFCVYMAHSLLNWYYFSSFLLFDYMYVWSTSLPIIWF